MNSSSCGPELRAPTDRGSRCSPRPLSAGVRGVALCRGASSGQARDRTWNPKGVELRYDRAVFGLGTRTVPEPDRRGKHLRVDATTARPQHPPVDAAGHPDVDAWRCCRIRVRRQKEQPDAGHRPSRIPSATCSRRRAPPSRTAPPSRYRATFSQAPTVMEFTPRSHAWHSSAP
jgi:hypothetical protein